MSEEFKDRIVACWSRQEHQSPDELPKVILDALAEFEATYDQIPLFREWEGLEVREFALRFAHASPEQLQRLSTVLIAAESEDDEQTEPESEFEPLRGGAPPTSTPAYVNIRPWLERITRSIARDGITSEEFASWAIAQCRDMGISRWTMSQALEAAREVSCPKADLLVEEQRRIEGVIVTKNLRAALHWAYRLKGDLPLILAFGVGLAGVRRAARAFEYERGNKFLTLGIWWIRQSISRARQDHALPIRIPVHRLERLGKLKRAIGGMTHIETQGLTPNTILKLINQHEARLWTTTDAEQTQLLDRPQRRGEFENPTDLEPLLDTLFDEFRPTPAEVPPSPNTLGTAARELDQILDYVERTHKGKKQARTFDIVVERLQLHGRPERPTLEELGRRYKITRERIRQVQANAFEKMSKTLGLDEK